MAAGKRRGEVAHRRPACEQVHLEDHLVGSTRGVVLEGLVAVLQVRLVQRDEIRAGVEIDPLIFRIPQLQKVGRMRPCLPEFPSALSKFFVCGGGGGGGASGSSSKS